MNALKWFGFLLLVLIACVAVFGAREPIDLKAGFNPHAFGEGIDVYLEVKESYYDDIRPGLEKQVIWAGQRETRTPISIVYLHGFSGSSAEIRPVPDLVAKALGANLYYTRFTGHGRDDPDAMAEVSVNMWMHDVAEALAVGRAIGDEVLVISTSTGGTIAAQAALQSEMMEDVMGMVFISPNFGINSLFAPFLTLPAARSWVPFLAGDRRSHEPKSPEYAKGWTTDYPISALFPMAALVKEAGKKDYSKVLVPALFYFSDEDRIVRSDMIRKVMTTWGGTVRAEAPTLAEGDDPNAHVIAGDIMSPGNTQAAADLIVDWANSVR